MSRLVIYGAGGFGREVLTAARLRRAVLADDRPTGSVIGPNDIRPDDEVVFGIRNSRVRALLAGRPYRFGSVIAPTAVMGSGVEIGEGAILCDFSMVTADARIGRHFHANIYSYVAHDCTVGDFVTLAPKACINGNVVLEEHVLCRDGRRAEAGVPGRPLRIGAGAVIGMGAVVTKDVAPGAVVVGNPARPLERPALKVVG